MKKIFGAIAATLAFTAAAHAQSNPCVHESGTNCTTASGPPLALTQPDSVLPCGTNLSVTVEPTLGLGGLEQTWTTYEDCVVDITNYPLPTSSIISNWWTASTGTPSSGAGSNAVFASTSYGTGTLTFHLTYSNYCGGTSAVSQSFTYTVVKVASLAPTGNTNCTQIFSNATEQTYTIPVSTNPAVSNLEIVAASYPSGSMPACWSLNGQATKTTYIGITNPGVYTVICSIGESAVTNIIWVTENGDVEQGCPGTGSSLLGYWSFNQPSNSLIDWWSANSDSNNVVYDSIGANNGTFYSDQYSGYTGTNITYSTGSSGRGFYFDGNGSYISFNTNVGNFGTNDFTIDFWVEAQGSGSTPLVTKEPQCSGNYSLWGISLSGGQVGVSVWGTNGTYKVSFNSRAVINNGLYHEITLQRNGLNLTLYVDGNLDTTVTAPGIADLENSTPMMAANSPCLDGGLTSYPCVLAEIKFYNGVVDPWSGSAGPWVGSEGQQPLTDYGLQNPASPWGNALKVDTNTSANLSYNYMENNGSANINCINGAVSFWYKPDSDAGQGHNNIKRLLCLGDLSDSAWSLYVDAANTNLVFETGSNSTFVTYFTNSIATFSSNNWYLITLDYSTNETSLFINGSLVQTGPGIVNYPDISDRVQYGFNIGANYFGTQQARGCIDELYTFNCPLTAQEVVEGIGAYPGYPGTYSPPLPVGAPWILTQPSNQVVAEGATATFSVIAIGSSPLSYQWSFNGSAIAGATNSDYSIRNAGTENAGNYFVTVANALGSVASDTATLEVPTCAPFANGSFESGFAGWTYDGTAIVLGSSGTLTASSGTNFAAFQGNGPGSISQAICVDPGSWYQVTFDYAASFETGQTNAPLTVEVWAGDQLLYYGLPNPTANWQTRTFQFQAPLNSTIATLSFLGNASPAVGVAAIDNITWTELGNVQLPVITVQPMSQTVNAASGSSFSVTAIAPPGSGNLTYQWQKNGVPIDGANSSVLGALSGPAKPDDGTYSVVVGTDGASGTVQSWDALLTVIDPAFYSQPQSFGCNVGDSGNMRVDARGTSPIPSGFWGLDYQWYKDGTILLKQNNPSLGLPTNGQGMQMSDAGGYYVVVTGLYGSVTSQVATVTVFNPTIFITAQPQSQVACLGDSISFSVATTGSQLTYQWYENGTSINGATGATYSIDSVASSDFGIYTVVVANANGASVTSAPAILYPTPSLNEGTIAVATDVGTITWFLPNGTPKYVLAATGNFQDLAVDMCFNSQADIICTYANLASLSIDDLCGFSTYLQGTPQAPLFGPTAVALDASGNTYVASGSGSPYGIMEFDPNGNFLNGYLTNTPVLAMDLDADQTSIFYVPAFSSMCYNFTNIFKLPVGGATGNPVLFSTMTNDGGYPRALRVLPDGSVLVADSINLKHNDATGTLATWDYVDPSLYDVVAISIDPSGGSAWVSDRAWAGNYSGVIGQVSLSSTNLSPPQFYFYSGSANQGALAVEGEVRLGLLITQQPISQTLCAGQSATFTVAASSRFPHRLSYAWYQNGAIINGATGTSYTTSQPGTYTVVLTSPDVSSINVTSAPAALIVGAPVIDRQPESQFLLTGQSALFSVTAEGAGLTYQWSKNGTNISGATGPTYSIGSVTTNDAGTYSVTVRSCANADSTVSAPAVLTVREAEPPGFFSGMINWWPGNGNFDDIIGGLNGDIMENWPVNVGFDTGEVNQAFCFYGNSSVNFTLGSGLNFGLGDFSIEFWMQSTSQDNEYLISDWDRNGSSTEWLIEMNSGYVCLSLCGATNNPANYPAYPFSLTSSKSVNDGAFHHVAVARHLLTLYIYIDGALSAVADAPGVANLTLASLASFGNGPGIPGMNPFVGKLDEITVYNRALTAAEAQLLYNEGSYGKLPRMGRVQYGVQEPFSWDEDCTAMVQPYVANYPGDAIYYTTNGTDPTTEGDLFQATLWVYDDGDCNFAPTYLKAFAVEPGYLNGEVCNYFFGLQAPAIVSQPMSQKVQENDSPGAPPVVLSVQVNSPPPVQDLWYYAGIGYSVTTTNLLYFGDTQYQWWFYGAPIFGATNSSLSLSPVPANAGNYMVTVSNAAGTTISSFATLEVGTTAPLVPLDQIISWWPAESNEWDVIGGNNGYDNPYGAPNASVEYVPGYVGLGFSFTDTNGGLATNYGVNVEVNDNTSLDPTGPFSLEGWVFLNDGRTDSGFRVVVAKTNQYELLYSVDRLRALVNNTACRGDIPLALNLWHHVALTYDGVSTMSLYLDGVLCGSNTSVNNQPGSTTNPLFIGGNNGVGDILDEIIFYNTNLSAQEIAQHSQATLGVASTISAPITVYPYCGFSYVYVNPTGRNPLSWQWLENGTPIPGQTGNWYSATNDGAYSVMVLDGLNNSMQSAPVFVAVSSNTPAITSQPQPSYVFIGDAAMFYVGATGDDLTYQWQFDGANIAGATNAELVIDNVQPAQTGSYDVIIQNACGSLTSQSAALSLVSGNIVGWGNCGTVPPASIVIGVAAGSPQFVALKSNGRAGPWSSTQGISWSQSSIGAVSAGSNYDLYLTQSGSVVADGNDGGSGAGEPPSSVTSPGTNLVTAISAGPAHALALMANQMVIGWGTGPEANAAGRTNITAISAGYKHSLVLNGNATVSAWGSNTQGVTNVPSGLSNVIAISAGYMHDMALTDNGTVVAWGNNSQGVTNVPIGLSNVVAIAAGSNYSMALIDNGTVVAWGAGTNGNPVPTNLQAVVAIAAGPSGSLAVTLEPIITAQPVGSTDNPGASVTLTVSARFPASATIMNYQWELNGNPIDGATGASYNMGSIQNGNMGVYTVLVIDDYATNVSAPATVLVNGAPPVIVSPQNPLTQTVPQGGSASFSVVAVGTGILTYQWQLNAVAIPGATGSNYTVSSAQAANAGNYTVVVGNSFGSVVSASMPLVVEPPFSIVQQPESQTVAVGSTAQFSVQTIGGVSPLSYQWFYTNDGGSLELGTNQTLDATNITFEDAGQIFVIVTDADGHALTSSDETLTVIPIWTPVPPGIVAWWKAEGNANDSIGTNNAISAQVSYVPGEVGQAFYFDGVSDQVTVADSPSLALTNTPFTIEGWVNILTDADIGYPVQNGCIMTRGNTNLCSYWIQVQPEPAPYWAIINFGICDDNSNAFVASCAAPEDEWVHLAAVYDPNAQTMTVYANGQVAEPLYDYPWIPYVSNPLSGVTSTPADDLTNAAIGIGNYANLDATSNAFCGMIDELSVYTNALTQPQIAGIYNAGTVGKELVAGPSIIAQPASQTAFIGSNVTFYVVAQSHGSLSYQWYLNGNTTGQGDSSLTISGVQTSDVGTYSVVVSDQYGSTTSSSATLTLGDPVICSPPLSQTAGLGMSVTFNVAAVGGSSLSYQWQSNNVPIPGATTPMFTINNLIASCAASYTVVASDSSGSVTSPPAVLTIQDPYISAWPMSHPALTGQSVTFTVGVAGTGPFTYQWSLNGTNISGATQSSYTISSVQPANSGHYQVVVTGKSQATADAYLSAIQHPIALPDIFQVSQNTANNSLLVLANDSFTGGGIQFASPLGTSFWVSSVTAASHGSVSISGDGQSVNYTTINPQYFGPDTFSYTITDAYGATNTAQVTVFVNENGNSNPTDTNYSITLEPGQCTSTINVLENASDPDNDVLSVYSVGTPSKGTAVIGDLGEIIYTRNPTQYGNDSFTFILTDGNGGYTNNTVQVAQVDNNGNGIPDQWEIDNGLSLSESDPMNSASGDGFPNLGKYLLGVNPNVPNNALNLGGMHDFGGGVNIPLDPSGRIGPSASLFATINGQEASQRSIFYLPDGTPWLNFATTTLSPGDYKMQVGIRTAVDSDIENTYAFSGTIAHLLITNAITVNNLTAEYAGSLHINGSLNVAADAYAVNIYNTQHALLATLAGAPQNGLIDTNWDLTDGNGHTIASGPLVVQMNASLGGVSKGGVWMDYSPCDSINGNLWVVAMGTPSTNEDVDNSEAADVANNVLTPLSYLNYIDGDVLPSVYDTDDDNNYNSVTLDNTFMWWAGNATESLKCRGILTNCLANPMAASFYWCRGHGDWESIAPFHPLPENELLFATNLAFVLQNAQYQGILDPPLFVRMPNQQPYRLTILLACGTYSYLWATTFGITRYVAPGSPWETKAIYDAAGIQHRAFVGWVPTWVWTYDQQQCAGENALFDQWEEQKGTIEDCMDAWKSAALLSLQNMPARPYTLYLAQYLTQYYISGCKDLDYNDGGVLQ